MVEMVIRTLVVLCFGISAAILFYAHRKHPYTAHLPGLIIWCLHVIVFTLVVILHHIGLINIAPRYLNIWSNIVRLHGGICMIATGWYYIFIKKEIVV